jgi:hypothetical protein
VSGVPKEWREALVTPINKKREITECESYRGISLLNVGYKPCAELLASRLRRIFETITRRINRV